MWKTKEVHLEVYGEMFKATYSFHTKTKEVEDIAIFHKDTDLTNHVSDNVTETVKDKIYDYEL